MMNMTCDNCSNTQINTTTATDKDNHYFNDIKLTVIVGPPADKMIQSLKRGQAFFYIDKSVEGVSILEVWVEVDKDFWWD